VVLWLAGDVECQDDMKIQCQETSPMRERTRVIFRNEMGRHGMRSATTIFNGVIFLTGGKRSDFIRDVEEREFQIKRADVWYSITGADLSGLQMTLFRRFLHPKLRSLCRGRAQLRLGMSAMGIL
jgi:hypothetical protein